MIYYILTVSGRATNSSPPQERIIQTDTSRICPNTVGAHYTMFSCCCQADLWIQFLALTSKIRVESVAISIARFAHLSQDLLSNGTLLFRPIPQSAARQASFAQSKVITDGEGCPVDLDMMSNPNQSGRMNAVSKKYAPPVSSAHVVLTEGAMKV